MSGQAHAGAGRHLLLLRHAKSSWCDPGLADRDRPLNARGRAACDQVGRFLARVVNPPDRVLCSPAMRTRETWERISPELGWPVEAEIDGSLYAATAAGLRTRLGALDNDDRAVLLVGHNPALQELAMMLAGEGRADLLERLAAKFPTAAFAEIALESGPWGELATGSGRLVRYVTVREGAL